jgi:hypothetical protein
MYTTLENGTWITGNNIKSKIRKSKNWKDMKLENR